MLDGKSIIVTGGAGHLGLPICNELAKQGAKVLCLSSRKADSNQFTSLVCDVSDEADFNSKVAAFAQTNNGIDGLVNCAARAPRGIDLEMSSEAFAKCVSESLIQYFTTTRVTLRYANKNASAVNVASMWGKLTPNPSMYLDMKNEPSVAWASASAGILHMTKYLAVLYSPSKMRINALIPGWFPRNRGTPRPDYMNEIESRIPFGRIGKPEDLTGAVTFLLSDWSRYMTGQEIVVDGGYSLRGHMSERAA